MTDNTELKQLAEAAPGGPWISENDSLYFKDGGYARHLLDADAGHDVEDEAYYAALKFIAAANPAAVLALIAENEQLREDPNMRAIRSLRGDCADLIVERDQLKAENERLFKLLERTVEQYVPLTELEGVPGWSRVVELVEVVVERDQLRAEVAGLKTGYEAYERVNAELKAENEALRKALKTAEDAMWHADGNMDGEAADARDALAVLGQGEQS